MKVSVVISAFNEEVKIEKCLQSLKNFADEIILIDNSSTDDTVKIAKKYTDNIFSRENNPMLNVNKNFGFTKASNEWILSLDADEIITEELASEIKDIKETNDVNGYYIPRKNIIFGKWIRHTGWYPDYQLRLFRKDKGKFAEKQVHEMISLDGVTKNLSNPMLHMNYENISQFLNKMVRTYTVSEAENLRSQGYKYNALDLFKMPLSEFIKRYFAERGYRDGMHGLVLSLLQGFYHFVVFLRLWEANNYPDEKDTQELLKEGKKMISHEFKYWVAHAQIENESNTLKKQLLKVKRKILH
jgi:glycosyltransferase involved in cell wall biosynthesis